jgi:hypothetical protein
MVVAHPLVLGRFRMSARAPELARRGEQLQNFGADDLIEIFGLLRPRNDSEFRQALASQGANRRTQHAPYER